MLVGVLFFISNFVGTGAENLIVISVYTETCTNSVDFFIFVDFENYPNKVDLKGLENGS